MITNKNKQYGFTLIEVLTSLVVIGTGILGLTGLQLASFKNTNNAHSTNVAVMIAMELSDRMRANPVGVAGGFYDSEVDCVAAETQCRNNTSCSPEQIARADIQEMMCGVRRNSTGNTREGGAAMLLPNGGLKISCDSTCTGILTEHTITVSWSVAKLDKRQSDDFTQQSVSISVTP